MIKDIQELKKFMTWAKENKVKSFKSGEISFEFSELALVSDQDIASAYGYTEEKPKQELPQQESTEEQDDETLYWSSN